MATQEPTIDELTDQDFKGPEGSRYSNAHLFLELLEWGHVFDQDGNVALEVTSQFWSTFTEILVFQTDDYSGVTHEWRLPEREIHPWQLNQPKPTVVTIYETHEVYGGPEEGGWHYYPRQAIGFVVLDSGYAESSIQKGLETAELLVAIAHEEHGDFNDEQGWYRRDPRRLWWQLENVPGYDHSVGSQFYC